MIMKKEYKMPFIRLVEAETEDMLAVSLLEAPATNDDALSREAVAWPTDKDLWVEEEQ